jgi:hypothetical protein
MRIADEQCGLSTNATPFLRNLRMLSNYNPDPNQPGGKHPPVGTSPVPEPYCTALANAYNATDRSLRDALDSLTNTFIVQNQDSCSGAEHCSWGYIDRLSGDGTHTYIGLSSGLWNSDGTPKFATYGAFAEQTARTLLLDVIPQPISVQANPDSPSLALIASLAHEMGHIKWWADDVRTSTCHDSVADGNTGFTSIAWSNVENTPAWRNFGIGDLQSINIDTITLGQFQGDSQHGIDGTLLNDLIALYGGRWPSMFSIVAPDEDFVETYTLVQVILAMRRQSPSSASLQVTLLPQRPNARTIDLLSLHDRPADPQLHKDLHHKVQWIKHCVR